MRRGRRPEDAEPTLAFLRGLYAEKNPITTRNAKKAEGREGPQLQLIDNAVEVRLK